MLIGTTMTSFSSACSAYAVGKVTYLGTRWLLDNCSLQLSSKNTKRMMSWGVSLLCSGITLKVVTDKVTNQSMSYLAVTGVTLGVTGLSLGVRALVDESYKYLVKKNRIKEIISF